MYDIKKIKSKYFQFLYSKIKQVRPASYVPLTSIAEINFWLCAHSKILVRPEFDVNFFNINLIVFYLVVLTPKNKRA